MEYLLGGKVKNMKIKLFESSSEDSSFIKDIVSSLLIESGFYITESNKFDIGIAIGGDGTFLHMVMETDFNPSALFIGINNGTLGFLQEIKPNEIKKLIVRKGRQTEVNIDYYNSICKSLKVPLTDNMKKRIRNNYLWRTVFNLFF